MPLSPLEPTDTYGLDPGDVNGSYGNWSNYTQDYDAESINNIYMFYYVLWTFVVPTIFGTIVVVGTIGNTLVIYVILSRSAMQTVTNLLLLNLAVSDIAFLIFSVPLTAYRYAASTWPFGDLMCKINNYAIYVTTYVTVYTLVAISLLRYVTIIHNTSTAKYRTKRNIILLAVLIWVVILLVNIPGMLTQQLKVFDPTYSYCGMVDGTIKAFYLSFFVFSYVLPLLLICLMYIVVVCHLKKVGESGIDQTRMRTARASKVILLVIAVFMLSWLPLQVNQMLSSFGKVPDGPWYEVFRILCSCMAYGNSCVNPIIYNFVSKDFKKGFKEVMCCCRKRAQSRDTQTTQTILERTAMI